jgi:hypothetical protein
MSKKTDRRAAEREARKLAFQQLRQAQAAVANPTPEPTPEAVLETTQASVEITEPPTVSEAQLNANRANAQLSTGPVTETGRAISAQNSLKHGLTSKTVVLLSEEYDLYQNQLNAYIDHHAPATDEELRLVQSMVASLWRLNRIRNLETAFYIKGRNDFAGKFEDQPETIRKALIDAEAYLKYEKSLKNLNIQETRLNRMYDKDRAELQRLQITRKRDERIAAEAAAKARATPTPHKNGFDFSTQPLRPSAPATNHQNHHREAA